MYCEDCRSEHADVINFRLRIAEDHKNFHDTKFVSDQVWRKSLSSENLQDRLWDHVFPKHKCTENCIDDWHGNVGKYEFWLEIKVLVSGGEPQYQNKESPLGGIYGPATPVLYIGPLSSPGRLTIADCVELQRRIDPSETGRHQIIVTIQVKNHSPAINVPFQEKALEPVYEYEQKPA